MSVYGKKIVIDDVEYVAVPDKSGWCDGCAMRHKCYGTDLTFPSSNAFRKAFGGICSLKLKMILKKVAPKKKPEKPFVGFKTDKAWDVNPDLVDMARSGLPSSRRRELNATPLYLNPTQMMMNGQSVLIDGVPHLITRVDRAGSASGMSQTIEFVCAANVPPRRCFGDYGKTPLHGAGYTPTKEPETQYIVCLSESCNIAPSENPRQHDNELAATKEAQRLCRKHNQKFVVLKVIAEVEPEIQTKVTKR